MSVKMELYGNTVEVETQVEGSVKAIMLMEEVVIGGTELSRGDVEVLPADVLAELFAAIAESMREAFKSEINQ